MPGPRHLPTAPIVDRLAESLPGDDPASIRRVNAAAPPGSEPSPFRGDPVSHPDVTSEYQKHSRFTSVSICAPSVRMIAIEAWAYTDDDGTLTGDHVLHPVVAIESSVVHRYSIRLGEKGGPRPVFGSHRELINNGWTYEGHHVATRPFIAFEGLLRPAFDAFPEECTCAVYTCDWPASVDERMLQEEIERLHDAAIELLRQAAHAAS
jgi:hypothetical protein